MKCFCTLTGIILACSTAVLGQDGKPGNLFKQLDKNSDGKLVADEIPEKQSRFFERLVRIGDADENGELSQAEFSKATSENADAPARNLNGNGPGRRPGVSASRQFDPVEFFKRLDRNGDGKVAKSELPDQFAQRLAPAFEKLGKDEITLEEFQKLRQQFEKNGSRMQGGRPGQFGNPSEMFGRLDTNSDGKLTIDEVPEQGRRIVAGILERSGKGRDGSLSKKEFQSAIERFNRERNGQNSVGRNNQPAKRDGEMKRPQQSDRPQNSGPAFFRILDVNRDGRLSHDELAKAVKLIDRLDQNRDGSLDGRELFGPPPGGQGSTDRPRQNATKKDSDRPRRPQSEESVRDKPKDRQRSSSDQPNRERRSTNVRLEETFDRMDRDEDGAISKDESPDRLKQNFDRVDANKDGKITLEELHTIFGRSRKQ